LRGGPSTGMGLGIPAWAVASDGEGVDFGGAGWAREEEVHEF
jgi:hypothetical protein